MRIAIFNVKAGLAVYLEFSSSKLLYDLGCSEDFCPAEDFLIPLYQKRKSNKNSKGKFEIDQLIISHPHDDHISAIERCDKKIYPKLLTLPNDNKGMPDDEIIDWNLIKNKSDKNVKYLREKMLPGRTPPLKPLDYHLEIFYIPAKQCEKSSDLKKDNYGNNLSIVAYVKYNGHKILLMGDLMKDGIAYLVKKNTKFLKCLKNGVDFLVAPHHGLKTSFSTELFNSMRNKKTKRLNIVSEKPNSNDSRNVDSRYSSEEFCEGKNNLSKPKKPVYQRKTSNGHIFIDCRSQDPIVKIISRDSDLVKEFL